MTLTYAKPERIWLKTHPELDECWLQDRIGEDPSLLGFGDLVLKDRDRIQPRAGRLDLLLQDVEMIAGDEDDGGIVHPASISQRR